MFELQYVWLCIKWSATHSFSPVFLNVYPTDNKQKQLFYNWAYIQYLDFIQYFASYNVNFF